MKTMESELLAPVQEKDAARRRIVYNGDAAVSGGTNEFARRNNRAIPRKRHSTLLRIVLLMTASLVIVFYVWNKITVNRLLVEVNDLNSQYQKLLTDNDLLRAEINRKASIDRIATVAARLGLVYPKQQPTWFDADPGLMERFGDK